MPPVETGSSVPLSLPAAPTAARTRDEPLLEPGTRLGSVTVVELLGRGGMCQVYRVRRDGRVYALKILDPRSLGAGGPRYQRMLFARLRREGRLQQSIRHPNIVHVDEIIETPDGPALLMECVEGPSLATLVQQRGGLSWDDVDDIAQGLMSAIARAQRAGIVHRDVKPGNVLVTRVGGRWVPKLTDFGLAKLAQGGDDLTLTGQVMGTPGYMPPRQMSDAKHVDCTVDTFALGAVLYELATGRRLVPVWQRVNPDLVRIALKNLERSAVPARVRRAIDTALFGGCDAVQVLATWQGATAGAGELSLRPWAVLTVLALFAASLVAFGILGLG